AHRVVVARARCAGHRRAVGAGVVDRHRAGAGVTERDREGGRAGRFIDRHVVDAEARGVVVDAGGRARGAGVGGAAAGDGGGQGEGFVAFGQVVIGDRGAHLHAGAAGGDGGIGGRHPGAADEHFQARAVVGGGGGAHIGQGEADAHVLHAGVGQADREHGVRVGPFGDRRRADRQGRDVVVRSWG